MINSIENVNKSIDTVNKCNFASSIKSIDAPSMKSYCVTNLRTGRKQTYEFDEDSYKFNLTKDEYIGAYFSD